MKRLMNYVTTCVLIVSFLSSSPLSKAQEFTVDTIMKSGSIDHCINVVYLGDGYRATEQYQYLTAVQTINQGFFQRVPFSNYKDFFNVFAVEVLSFQSGVNHPRSASDCPPVASFPTMQVNNYFKSSFDVWNIHRLIYPLNITSVYNVLSQAFPYYDQILMIVNTDKYGGAGGDFGVSTEHESCVEVFLHEMAHSFAGLSDEYWEQSLTVSESPNRTHFSNISPDVVRWKDWLGVDGVGIYPHCCGGSSGDWYKPSQNCAMQISGNEFCVVCRQRIIERIYELVNPIIEYSPSETTLDSEETLEFKITKLIKPIPNTLKIEWVLNGEIMDVNVDSLSVNSTLLEDGDNVLSAVVTDTTDMLRVAPNFTHHINNVTWNIHKSTLGVTINDKVTRANISIYPNPAKDYINIEGNGLSDSSAEIGLKVIDLSGAEVLSETTQSFMSTFKKQLDVSSLPAGFYYVSVTTEKINRKYKVVIY